MYVEIHSGATSLLMYEDGADFAIKD